MECGKVELKRSSNTTNPFAFGSSEQLRSLIVGLMRESSDGMWKGRASSMMAALLKALVYLRNSGVITLDVGTIRENMTLDKLVELMKNTTLSKEAISAVKAYLAELPTYTEEDAFMGEIQSKAYEQHGYLQIQLTEVMSDLSETYGHIFNVPKGEINFADVIFNRRILFVMLPSIEKDPDALAGLGKLVVSGIKSSLAVALGYDVEGTKVNVIDTKPSNAKVPFFILLDEYGFYAVEGFAVVAAQARSLGVCVGYFGQDFTSFKKASEIEASQTEANTNIKIFMKIEESKDTAEIAERRGGEASISTVSGYQNRGSVIGGLSSQDTAQIMKVKRINLRDLVRQEQGEAHVIYGDTLSRCRLFYADPMQMNLSFLNKFIMIESQKKNIVDNINKVTDRLNSMFSDTAGDNDSEQTSGDKPVIMDDAVKNLVNDFSLCFSKEGSFTNAAITSIGLISVRERIKDAELEEKAGMDSNYSNKKEPIASSVKMVADDFEDEFDEFQNSGGVNDFNDIDMPSDTSEESSDEDESGMVEFNEDDFPDALAAMEDDSKPSTSIIDEAKKAASEFSDLLSGMVVANAKKYSESPLTASEVNNLNPVNRLIEIEKRFGETDDIALKNAKSDMDILSQKVVYAVSPVPEKAPVQVLEDRFLSMMKILKTT